jgi:hypothetical protein
LLQKSESVARQTKQLPRWLLWWAAQLTLWTSMQARTKQLLSMSLLTALQIFFIMIWNLVNSSHLNLVSIYPNNRCIQVGIFTESSKYQGGKQQLFYIVFCYIFFLNRKVS